MREAGEPVPGERCLAADARNVSFESSDARRHVFARGPKLMSHLAGILLLVTLGHRGVNLLSAHFIEHNEKRISGIVLIVVGIISFFLH